MEIDQPEDDSGRISNVLRDFSAKAPLPTSVAKLLGSYRVELKIPIDKKSINRASDLLFPDDKDVDLDWLVNLNDELFDEFKRVRKKEEEISSHGVDRNPVWSFRSVSGLVGMGGIGNRSVSSPKNNTQICTFLGAAIAEARKGAVTIPLALLFLVEDAAAVLGLVVASAALMMVAITGCGTYDAVGSITVASLWGRLNYVQDAAAVLGLVVASAALMMVAITGCGTYDAVGSITVGLVMGKVAVFLIQRNRHALLCHAPKWDSIQGEETFQELAKAMRLLHSWKLHVLRESSITPGRLPPRPLSRATAGYVSLTSRRSIELLLVVWHVKGEAEVGRWALLGVETSLNSGSSFYWKPYSAWLPEQTSEVETFCISFRKRTWCELK